MPLITQIQAQYPDPIASYDDDGMPDCYCVGGGIVMFASMEWNDEDSHNVAFPNSADLGDALHKLNPALPWEQAEIFAVQIIEANDDERFGDAWQIAAQALTL